MFCGCLESLYIYLLCPQKGLKCMLYGNSMILCMFFICASSLSSWCISVSFNSFVSNGIISVRLLSTSFCICVGVDVFLICMGSLVGICLVKRMLLHAFFVMETLVFICGSSSFLYIICAIHLPFLILIVLEDVLWILTISGPCCDASIIFCCMFHVNDDDGDVAN